MLLIKIFMSSLEIFSFFFLMVIISRVIICVPFSSSRTIKTSFMVLADVGRTKIANK
uniref:Uncharacterized protein n=1 Tax=Rhizophora mucronata TaxID=61149 RepID=A0A2P2Q422_RHIMU